MNVSNDILRSVRDASRELTRLVRAVEEGRTDKYVITRSGKMCAVLISVERYESLLRGEDGQS